MFNRFFSRKEKARSAPAAVQGSMLDLLDEAGQASGNIVDFPTGQSSSGSLLSAINDIEVEAARSQQIAQAERSAAQRDEAHQLAARQMAVAPSQYQSAHPYQPEPNVSTTASELQLSQLKSQQEQLDLLSRELEDVAEVAGVRKNEKPDIDSVGQNQRHTGRANAGRMVPDYVSPAHRPTVSSGFSLFSFEAIVRALFRGWWAICACGLIGACIAAIYSLSLPNKYLSVAEILIEPREIRVIERSVMPSGLNSEATVAYAESQVRILTSSSVLDPVIEDLELAEDSEFNGSGTATGLFGFLTSAIVGEADNPGERFSKTKEYLYENMYVSRINQTFTIQIGVSTEEAAKSARVANAIARGYMNAESRAKNSAARNATEDLTGRLDELRAQVRMSEERVEAYKAENGLVDADGKLVSEVQLSRLNDQLAVAQSQVSDTRSRAEQAAQADLSDVLSGSLPTALASPTVSQLRVQFSRAKSRLDRISTTLGPRHPDRIGAEAELRSARQAIAGELSRIVESAQEDFRSARSRLAATQAQVNTLKASAVTDSAAKVKLRELEREVTANRNVFESFLLRSRETGEQENIRTESARIISEATPPVEKEGPNRKLITMAGGVGGGILGMLLVLIPFAFTVMRDLVSGGGTGPAPTPQQQVSYDDDLYSSYPPGEGPVPPKAHEAVAVARTTPQKEARYRGSPTPSVKEPSARQMAAENDRVTREELETLRREMQNQQALMQQPQQAQQPQPAPVAAPQPVQMPLFAQPQHFAPYPQPQPIYPAPVPLMHHVGYPPPLAPVMPQPVHMAYPVWPQQPVPPKDGVK